MYGSPLSVQTETAVGVLIQGGSMPWQQTSLAELGRVEVRNDQYRAHVQHRNSAGLNVNVRGPDRSDRRRAETDLDQMRAAGAIGTTREQGLQYMAAEARRLQVSASFEAEVRTAVQRQRAAEEEETAVYPSVTRGAGLAELSVSA